jgi:hypothetical protein
LNVESKKAASRAVAGQSIVLRKKIDLRDKPTVKNDMEALVRYKKYPERRTAFRC